MGQTERRATFSQEYAQRAPKSKCQCGHSGDGAHSDHKDTVQKGHGACKKCPAGTCAQFSWASWLELFERALQKIK